MEYIIRLGTDNQPHIYKKNDHGTWEENDQFIENKSVYIHRDIIRSYIENSITIGSSFEICGRIWFIDQDPIDDFARFYRCHMD